MSDIETIKLKSGDKPPHQRDLVAEVTMTKTRHWISVVVSGLLFKEEVPGAFNSLNEALDATKRFVAKSGRNKLYYRQKSEGGQRITKRRFSRSY